MLRDVLMETAAGAVGTVALNVTTYADMATRGRPASSVPAQVAGKLVDKVGIDLYGESEGPEGDTAQNRKTAAERMIHTLIMAKAPVPGMVKTRLRLKPRRAAELQRAFLMDVVAKAQMLGSVTVAGSPKERLDLIESVLPLGVRLIAQVEGDLGERMRAGAAELLARKPDPILILGTDAPTLPPGYLREAARALNRYDASIIPSRDGGYVLLGLKRLHDALFSRIAWSTEIVYWQTVERAKEARISLLALEPWYDVDTPADLERLRVELKANPSLAPHTAEVVGRVIRA